MSRQDVPRGESLIKSRLLNKQDLGLNLKGESREILSWSHIVKLWNVSWLVCVFSSFFFTKLLSLVKYFDEVKRRRRRRRRNLEMRLMSFVLMATVVCGLRRCLLWTTTTRLQIPIRTESQVPLYIEEEEEEEAEEKRKMRWTLKRLRVLLLLSDRKRNAPTGRLGSFLYIFILPIWRVPCAMEWGVSFDCSNIQWDAAIMALMPHSFAPSASSLMMPKKQKKMYYDRSAPIYTRVLDCI